MVNLILFGLYVLLALTWILLLLSSGRRYRDLIDPLDSDKYMLKSLYPVGMRILELVKYSYNTGLDKKRKAQAMIVYGERFGEYYYRINVAEKVTYVSICITITPLLGPLFNSTLFCLFGLVAAGTVYYYADSKITDVIKERDLSISSDFPDMVSKMALLINAGMITREAWNDISVTGNGVLYEEMKIATLDMENGVSEIDAYISFGNRCGVPFVKKFISMLVQNLSKGNKELVEFLKTESVFCWEEKKHLVKRQGEAAASKLMLPLGMILVGVFIMILVPILSKIGL